MFVCGRGGGYGVEVFSDFENNVCICLARVSGLSLSQNSTSFIESLLWL